MLSAWIWQILSAELEMSEAARSELAEEAEQLNCALAAVSPLPQKPELEPAAAEQVEHATLLGITGK